MELNELVAQSHGMAKEKGWWDGWDLDAVIQAKMAYNSRRIYRHGGKTA